MVQLDRSLLSALVERWRIETHTFHLPCGEMAPTLQDVAFLLRFPIEGPAVGPRQVRRTWKAELEARFENVQLMDGLGDPIPHPDKAYGPMKSWFLHYQV